MPVPLGGAAPERGLPSKGDRRRGKTLGASPRAATPLLRIRARRTRVRPPHARPGIVFLPFALCSLHLCVSALCLRPPARGKARGRQQRARPCPGVVPVGRTAGPRRMGIGRSGERRLDPPVRPRADWGSARSPSSPPPGAPPHDGLNVTDPQDAPRPGFDPAGDARRARGSRGPSGGSAAG